MSAWTPWRALIPAKEIVGAEIAEQVEKVAIKLYCECSNVS